MLACWQEQRGKSPRRKSVLSRCDDMSAWLRQNWVWFSCTMAGGEEAGGLTLSAWAAPSERDLRNEAERVVGSKVTKGAPLAHVTQESERLSMGRRSAWEMLRAFDPEKLGVCLLENLICAPPPPPRPGYCAQARWLWSLCVPPMDQGER